MTMRARLAARLSKSCRRSTCSCAAGRTTSATRKLRPRLRQDQEIRADATRLVHRETASPRPGLGLHPGLPITNELDLISLNGIVVAPPLTRPGGVGRTPPMKDVGEPCGGAACTVRRAGARPNGTLLRHRASPKPSQPLPRCIFSFPVAPQACREVVVRHVANRTL